MAEKYQALLHRLREITQLNNTLGVLEWDLQTQMPPGGGAARAEQMATLSRIAHDLQTSDETARLLEDAARELDGADYDSDEASMVRVAQLDYEEEVKLPSEYVEEVSRATTLAHEKWAKARAEDNFRGFQSPLEHIVDLMIQGAEYLGYGEQPYDALLNRYERGMTTTQVKQIFDQHKPDLVALIAGIKENANRVDDSVLHQPFDIDKQRTFALDVVKGYGFDFERGRQDIAVHPFATSFSKNDVRITTRFLPDFLKSSPVWYDARGGSRHV